MAIMDRETNWPCVAAGSVLFKRVYEKRDEKPSRDR